VEDVQTPEHPVVFLSHASEDKDRFARDLATKLQASGVRVWFDDDVDVTVYTSHASDWNFGEHAAFSYAGFFQPVDNPGILNSVKAGVAVPVRFSLSGDQGLGVLARGYPVSQKIACDSAAPIDVIEQTVNGGSSSLTFSASAKQYTYVWKTDASWAGTCRALTLKLADGTIHTALFKFKK
jgi:hypothetical protein